MESAMEASTSSLTPLLDSQTNKDTSRQHSIPVITQTILPSTNMAANFSNMHHFSADLRIIFVSVEVVIAVLIVITNALVLTAFILDRSLRTVVNCYVISIVVTDIMAGVFVIPTGILSHYDLVVGNIMCKCFAFFHSLIEAADVYCMVLVAVDRYFRFVVSPTRDKKKHGAMLPISVVWFCAFLYALKDPFINEVTLEVTFNGKEFVTEIECWIPQTSALGLKIVVVLNFLLLFCIPLTVVCFCYTSVNLTFKRSPQTANGSTKYARKAVYVHMAVVLTFLLTECGLHVIKLVVGLTGHAFENETIVHEVCTTIAFADYWINAVIYGFFNNNFRRSLLRIFKRGHKVSPTEITQSNMTSNAGTSDKREVSKPKKMSP